MGIEAFAGPMMSSLGAAAPALQVAGMAAGAVGAYRGSQASKAAYNAQAQIAGNNAIIAGFQADDATRRGGQAASYSRLKTGAVKSGQRAAMAANGVDLAAGSAQQVLNSTDYVGALDANTILDNAAREAWGYRTQASNFGGEADLLRGRADAESPFMAAGSSLLTSGGRVAASWYATDKSAGSRSSPGDGLSQGERRKIGVY